MAKPITQDFFIQRVKEIHGDKYDCSKVVYRNIKSKVVLTCKVHGDFLIAPDKILHSHQGCGKCAGKGKTTEDFIREARNVHGDRYNYDKAIYRGAHVPITITCKIHGDFQMSPYNHIKIGCNCHECSNGGKWTNDKLIRLGKEKYGDKFDYSLADVKNGDAKVEIKCNSCGTIFSQSPSNHIYGLKGGCPTCRYKYVAEGERIPFGVFVKKARKIHGDKYLYHKENYRSIRDRTRITCPKHGDFWQQSIVHLSGCGCTECGREKIANNLRLNTSIFLGKAKKVHGDRYDYSKTQYIDWITKLTITCRVHGDFKIKPYDHWRGRGCPKCKSTIGENAVDMFLTKNKITFIKEYRIRNTYKFCTNKILQVDFYLPDNSTIIEFNGAQHFMAVEYWGGEKEFERQKSRDEALRKHCKDNGINLIEIPYYDISRIDSVLAERLNIKKY